MQFRDSCFGIGFILREFRLGRTGVKRGFRFLAALAAFGIVARVLPRAGGPEHNDPLGLMSGWHWSALFRRIVRRLLRGIETQAKNFLGIPADFGGGVRRPR